MIRYFLTILAVFCTLAVSAQDNTSSPYSYYGIGIPSFFGSAEERAMQGMSITADSARYNLHNPASMGALKLTTYAVGATQTIDRMENAEDRKSIRNTSFDYISVGIPVGKVNFGVGLVPQTRVGYKLKEETEEFNSRFSGNGGLNKVFLTVGYEPIKNLRFGIQGDYNFGKIQNENILFQSGIQYGTREKNRSDLSGVSFKVASQYEFRISKKLRMTTSAIYTPKQKLNSKNQRLLATINPVSGVDLVVNEHEVQVGDTDFYIPSELRVGAGIGQFQKWFVGFEYQNIGVADYTNTSFSPTNIEFKKSNIYRLGGYYIPNFNDITNYFKRITFRAGVRYQENGMRVNQQDIDEFGISFGLGLPAGRFLSNFNLGVEYGQRGTVSSGLVKEEFVNIFVGLTLNDRWFIKRRFN